MSESGEEDEGERKKQDYAVCKEILEKELQVEANVVDIMSLGKREDGRGERRKNRPLLV